MQKSELMGGSVSVSPDHEVTPKNRTTTLLSYNYWFCSVDKIIKSIGDGLTPSLIV